MSQLSENEPTRIGAYEIIERLGDGASGVVYKARNPEGIIVAIKAIRSELARDAAVRGRLVREAEALRRVSGFRTVKVLEIDIDGVVPYLAMEFVPGQNLENFIKLNGPMRGAQLVGLIEALIEGLISLQEANVAHLDLKPSNILIGPDGVKIVDFGISSFGGLSSIGDDSEVAGTFSWLSPEQTTGQTPDFRSDVFNFGMVVTFAATGQHPFGEGRADAIMYRIVHSAPEIDALPGLIRKIVQGCLEKSPEKRTSLTELQGMLRSQNSNDGQSDDNASEAEFLATSTRVISASNSTEMTNDGTHATSDSAKSTSRFVSLLKKKKFLLAAVAMVMLIGGIAAVVVLSLSGENKDEIVYESEFVDVLKTVERLEQANETFIEDVNEIESFFFKYDWKKGGYVSFGQYVSLAGQQFWIPEFQKVYVKFYDIANPLMNYLRSDAVPEVKKKEDILIIRNLFINHYSVWFDYAEKYEQAIDEYSEDLDDSWEKVSERKHETLSSEIKRTFESACSQLGQLQPVSEKVDFSPRIANICED
jgi:serine/threonine protein kinase